MRVVEEETDRQNQNDKSQTNERVKACGNLDVAHEYPSDADLIIIKYCFSDLPDGEYRLGKTYITLRQLRLQES